MKFPSKSHITSLLLAAGLTLSVSEGNAQSIKAALDSSQITMGNVTAVRLDIVEKNSGESRLVIDENAFPKEVEPVDWVAGDTTDLGNGLREIKRALVIQSFDSGVYVLPPFCLVSGNDTLKSNSLTIKVNPVDVSHLNDIHPIAEPLEFQSKWYDFLPDWITDYRGWILAAVLIIAAGVCAYLIMTRKVAVNILPQKKRLPPYELAVKRLEALRTDSLWERGMEKEYYTRLIDILRDYLQERFGINAMEMTSTQIVKVLSGNEATRQPNRYMRNILQIADFVKFAKVRPLPDDNVRAFNEALQFVEETRPAPEAEADSESTNATPAAGQTITRKEEK